MFSRPNYLSRRLWRTMLLCVDVCADLDSMDEDILDSIIRQLHPLLAICICQLTRKAVLRTRACVTLYELKLALAMGRCTCLEERVAFVNLAIHNGASCTMCYGLDLQPHATGGVYGPSQLVTLQPTHHGDDMLSKAFQIHVVPLEASVNLVLRPPADTFECMRLQAMAFYPDSKSLRYQLMKATAEDPLAHGPANCADSQLTQRHHHGDHTSRWRNIIIQNTLYQHPGQPRDPYWQRMTFVSIGHTQRYP